MCASAQSCLTLCDPMDCNPPDSSVHRIFWARILEQIAISYSRGLSTPGIEPASSTALVLGDGLFTTVPHGKHTFNIAVAKLYNMVLILHVMQIHHTI